MERHHDTGASAVEYGLLLAAITAVIIAAVFLWGSAVKDLFTTSTTTIQQCVDGVSC